MHHFHVFLYNIIRLVHKKVPIFLISEYKLSRNTVIGADYFAAGGPEQNYFHITPIPVETDGISVHAVQSLFHTLLCVTLSHQFMDSGNRTIYLGTFSKSLSPDLRIAYVVLPAHLLPSYREKYLYANCTVPALLQLALAEYIESGEYRRHVNVMRTYYRKKYDYIRNYVRETLTGKAVLIGEDAGLHFVISIRTKQTQTELTERFAQNKIQIYPTELFWAGKTRCPQNQLLLGFGAIFLTQLPKYETEKSSRTVRRCLYIEYNAARKGSFANDEFHAAEIRFF